MSATFQDDHLKKIGKVIFDISRSVSPIRIKIKFVGIILAQTLQYQFFFRNPSNKLAYTHSKFCMSSLASMLSYCRDKYKYFSKYNPSPFTDWV
jgi:hypothetical protein